MLIPSTVLLEAGLVPKPYAVQVLPKVVDSIRSDCDFGDCWQSAWSHVRDGRWVFTFVKH